MPTYEHIKIADDNSFPGRGGTALDARYSKKGDIVVNVKDFGAVGDGATDDTAAFVAAFAAGQVVYVPSGSYGTSTGITVPAYKTLTGSWSRSYTGYSTGGARIKSLTPSQTGAVINLGIGAKIEQVAIFGAGKANSPQHDGIRAYNQSIIDKVTVAHARQGIECNYANGLVITANQIHDNTGNGINFPLDSIITHNTVNVNGNTGINLGEGGNDCTIMANKVEWNNGNGIALYRAHNINLTSNIVDRNGKVGIKVVQSSGSTIGPNISRRNGRFSQGTSADDVNILSENNNKILFVGNRTATGGDDANTGGGGYVSPAVGLREQSNTNCTHLGNDYSGGVTRARQVVVAGSNNDFIGNIGVDSILTTGLSFAAPNGTIFKLSITNEGAITATSI